MALINKIAIPDRMKHLKIDPRGYVIPHGVVVDAEGTAHFAMNNEDTRRRVVRENCCSICGTKLFRGRWFVGGLLSAFHPNGAFIDPPMHSECAHYAIQVCPYLAAPRYTGEIGIKKAEKAKFGDDVSVIVVDNTMIKGRPHEDVFVVLMATGQVVFENFNIKPVAPYSRTEFWRHGKRIPDVLGRVIAAEALVRHT